MFNSDGVRSVTRQRSRSAPSLLMYVLRQPKSRSPDTENENYSCSTTAVIPRNRHGLSGNSLPSVSVEENHHMTSQSLNNNYPNLNQKQKKDDKLVNLVVWSDPTLQVRFRDWYTYKFCNWPSVRTLSRIQNICRPLEPFLTYYFKFWSISGEAEFYVIFIPTMIWVGFPEGALEVASMLCTTQYVTGTLKDLCCCPRPPCPPLHMRGRRKTHDTEYGFPSTHSSNSIIFSYFIYHRLHHFVPRFQYLWLSIAFFFSINVSYSRLYLGMHWVGDIIGGWIVAVLCVLNHALYLNHFEFALVDMSNPPWWCYILVYVVIHILSIIHATPHDPCPCYLDSLRFLGVTMGSLYGFWIFKYTYGTLTARTFPHNIISLLISYRFWLEWAVCIVMVVIAKELSALLATIVLERVFKFLSGFYAGAFPPRVRRVYIIFVLLIGYTTRGRTRRPRSTTPPDRTTSNSINKSQTTHANGDAAAPGEMRQDWDRNGDQTAFSLPSNELDTTIVATNDREEEQQDGENTRGANQVEHSSLDEDEGYLNEYQMWALRTHKHWWLWEAHKYTFSYAVMGFVVVYISQMFLRKVFKIS